MRTLTLQYNTVQYLPKWDRAVGDYATHRGISIRKKWNIGFNCHWTTLSHQLIVAYWRHMATQIWVNTGNGLVPHKKCITKVTKMRKCLLTPFPKLLVPCSYDLYFLLLVNSTVLCWYFGMVSTVLFAQAISGIIERIVWTIWQISDT